MRNKLRLTEEQNKALSSYIFHYGTTKLVEQASYVGGFAAPYDSLNKLTWETVVQAVQFGWDIIPEEVIPEEVIPLVMYEFQKGDIVITPKGNVIKLIMDLGGNEFRAVVLYSDEHKIGDSGRVDLRKDGMRLATKDEIFFAKLGRKLLDFQDGDIFVDGCGTNWEVGIEASIINVLHWFSEGDCKGLIPAGAMVAYEGGAE